MTVKLHRDHWCVQRNNLPGRPAFRVGRKTKDVERIARRVDEKLDDLEHHLRHGTDHLPAKLVAWVQDQDAAFRRWLANHGLVSPDLASAPAPLDEHIDAFEDWYGQRRKRNGRRFTQKQVDSVLRRVRHVIQGCGFRIVQDINKRRVQQFVGKLEQTVTGKTVRDYAKDMQRFTRWLVEDDRLANDPLAGLNAGGSSTGRRRAFDANELQWLFDVTRLQTNTRCGLDGPERAFVYRVTTELGLRNADIRKLTAGSFHLNQDQATVVIRADDEKSQRGAELPVRPELASMLREHLANKLPTAPAFGMAANFDHRAADMFRRDLAAARHAWLAAAADDADREQREGSYFLADVDEHGAVACFHSLRHSTASLLASRGVHPKQIQDLMRHSTVQLTMDRYTHLSLHDLAAASSSLPAFDEPDTKTHQATGTCDLVSMDVSTSSSPVQADAQTGAELASLQGVDEQGVTPVTKKPPVGLEPTTCGLQNRCSAN